MRRSIVFLFPISLLFVIFAVFNIQLHGQSFNSAVITVNDVGDTIDASPGDGICADAGGKCTLRAAINESNESTLAKAILFDVPVPAVITLTLGELKVTNPIGIYGRGARRLTIERRNTNDTANFRIFNLIAATQLRGMTIRYGSSPTVGGGILAGGGVSIYDVTLTGNRARAGGGLAFQASEESYSIVERCLINSNTAYGEGGGIYVAPGTYPTIKTSTITGNSAAAGGAIANYGEPLLIGNTVARNSASLGSSSIINGSGSFFEIINTIVGPDTGQNVTSIEGRFFSLGYNIVTNTTGSSGWTSVDQISTNNALDPLLGALMDNGGQTDSIGLLAGSPAIDKGNDCVLFNGDCDALPNPTFIIKRDQRKYARSSGTHVDVGAYESGASLNSGTLTTSLFFGQTHRIAYSHVTVINTESLERKISFIALMDVLHGLKGGTPPLTFETPGVYLAQVQTKRAAYSNPQLLDY